MKFSLNQVNFRKIGGNSMKTTNFANVFLVQSLQDSTGRHINVETI